MAELHCLGQMLLELLLSSEAVPEAVAACHAMELLVRPSELLTRLGATDASAAWPRAAAHDAAVAAKLCCCAEAAGERGFPRC